MFAREDLESAFDELGRRALSDGRIVEIALYGGAALILMFPARAATKDVDVLMLHDQAWIRKAAEEIAEARGHSWPKDWLNDGVKGWLSHRDSDGSTKSLFRSYPSEDDVGLRVFVATAEYLFAMKCIAMRIGGVEAPRDLQDIELLASHLGIRSASAALNVVARYYPASRIPPKTAFGIEEIFGDGRSDTNSRDVKP